MSEEVAQVDKETAAKLFTLRALMRALNFSEFEMLQELRAKKLEEADPAMLDWWISNLKLAQTRLEAERQRLADEANARADRFLVWSDAQGLTKGETHICRPGELRPVCGAHGGRRPGTWQLVAFMGVSCKLCARLVANKAEEAPTFL